MTTLNTKALKIDPVYEFMYCSDAEHCIYLCESEPYIDGGCELCPSNTNYVEMEEDAFSNLFGGTFTYGTLYKWNKEFYQWEPVKESIKKIVKIEISGIRDAESRALLKELQTSYGKDKVKFI